MPVPEPVFDETEPEFFAQGIATRYYKGGLRYQPFIIVGDKFQSLGIFRNAEAARKQRATYLSSFNAIVQPYVNSKALAYFKAMDNREEWTEPDEEN